jgi:hypothetical protein
LFVYLLFFWVCADLDIIRSVWNAWQQEDADALDMTLADALEEVAKHPLSPNRYCYLSCMYVSKKLPEAFSLPRTCKVHKKTPFAKSLSLQVFLQGFKSPKVIKEEAVPDQLLLPISCRSCFLFWIPLGPNPWLSARSFCPYWLASSCSGHLQQNLIGP